MPTPTKWHINSKGGVYPCRARAGKCPLGGATGQENHFSSQEAAELYLAKSSNSFSALGTKRKKLSIEIGDVKDETKAAIEGLLNKGVSVSAPSGLQDLSNSTPTRASEVDILDEDLKGISIEKIRSLRPF